MAGMRGLAAVRALAEANKGGKFVNDFRLQDKESATLWFNGTNDEPLITYEHTFKNGNDFKTITCSYPKPCVGCYYHDHGDKRVGARTAKAAFNVADTRYFHTEKGMGRNGKERDIWTECPGEATCKKCRKGAERKMGGQKRWVMSLMWAQALDGASKTAGTRCRACKIGKIRVLKYVNDVGKEVLVDDPNNLPEGVIEKLACSNKACEGPTRATLFDVPWDVTRSGSQKSTSYQFVPGSFEDQPDEVLDLEPLDLDEACKPYGTGAQAKRLGMNDPFEGMAEAGGKKNLKDANITGDDDDEEAEEEEASGATPFDDELR